MNEQPERIAYSVPEVAAMCRVSEEAVRQLIHTGKLIAKSFGGEKNIRIGRAALEQFLITPDAPKETATNSNLNSNDALVTSGTLGYKRGPKPRNGGGSR